MNRRRRVSATLILATLCVGCGAFRGSRPAEPPVLLVVYNHSPFDVNIYALPSPASQTRIRLGNVFGFTGTELRVPVHALRQGQSLVLYLHAIGSNRSWMSPEVMVSRGIAPCLDIHADLSGGLDMSAFYSRFVPDDTSGVHCGVNRAHDGRRR